MPILLAVFGLLIAGFARAADPPFSHKRHAQAGIACAACHPSPAPGRRMTTVAAPQCDSCHRTRRVRTPAIKPTEWERVHELPREVQFSHKPHAGSKCSVCHGPVEQRDLATEDFPLNMAFCRECHLAAGAKSACGTCHPVK